MMETLRHYPALFYRPSDASSRVGSLRSEYGRWYVVLSTVRIGLQIYMRGGNE